MSVSNNTFYFSWHEAMKKLTPEQYGKLAYALNEYCFYDTEPENLEFPLDILFTSYKPNIDASKARKAAGKRGGEQGKGGAPRGNKNASKTIANQKQNNRENEEDEKVEVEDNDDPSSPFFYLDVKRQAGDRGFIIKHKQAQDFIDNVDNTWLTGRFNFFDYIAEGIKEKYFDLPLNEQTALFVDSWNQGFLISRFPAWRAEKERTAAETAKKKTFDNPPQICEKCGAGLLRVTEDRIICKPCRRIIDFVNGVWVVVEEGAA